MEKYTIKTYAVVNCNNDVIAIDSSINCDKMVKKMNSGAYVNRPYSKIYIDTTFEA